MRAMNAAIRTLSSHSRDALARHLCQLSSEERRLRFGVALSDAAIEAHVAAINFGRDKLFGLFEEGDALVGVAHVALPAQSDGAELGLSVAAGSRCLGYGYALLCTAALQARRAGRRRLTMHCLAENRIMIHLARKAGMSVIGQSGEAGAHMALGDIVLPAAPDAARASAGRRVRALLVGVLLPVFVLDMALMLAAGSACDSCKPQLAAAQR